MNWIVLFLYLTPLIIVGILLVRKITSLERIELLIPTGAITGISLFVFLLNLASFFIRGTSGIVLSYISMLCIGFAIYNLKNKSSKIEYLSGKSLFLYFLSFTLWIVFIFWKGKYALIGSDTNLYFAVAHTFMKGNFPPLTPWQPDLPLQYHLGPFELLGAFYLFTSLSFEFLHIFFSCIFIFLTSQLVIWFWKRHTEWISFIWANISAVIILVSFGFFKVIIPISPLNFPKTTDIHELFLWIRDLPTVNQSIEVYGAPVNLDGLIYFIFHSFGLALFLSLLVIFLHSFKKDAITKWSVLLFGLAFLALINESIFIATAPALFFLGILKEFQSRTFTRNFKIISILMLITGVLVLVQGGIVTNYIFGNKHLEKSILLFPGKEDVKEDFMAYHYNQEISKVLPLGWFHIGVDVLIVISLLCLTFVRYSKEQKLLVLALFLSGIFSLLSYNFIVPKFLIANGNRFLAFSFIFLSLSIVLSLQNLIYYLIKQKFVGILVLFILTFFIILPTILPPLFLLSINRFGEGKFPPKKEVKTAAIEWIEKNLPFSTKIMVLDARAPHLSGQSRAMVQAGVFAPVFAPDVRAYTIEASPEYLDIAYFLSPTVLQKLKIDTLLIDNIFFKTLPELRKKQLIDGRYFEKIFEHSSNENGWEKVYKISSNYFKQGGEIGGTLRQFGEIMSREGKIFIDNEENFNPSFIRRAIIFTLRDRNIYYSPQSGVYLNVEAYINWYPPLGDGGYDYLVLSKKTDPKIICKCSAKLIWFGLNDKIYVWKKN